MCGRHCESLQNPWWFLLLHWVFCASCGLGCLFSSQHWGCIHITALPSLASKAIACPSEFLACGFGKFPLTLEDFHPETENVHTMGWHLGMSETEGKWTELSSAPRRRVEESVLSCSQSFVYSKHRSGGGRMGNQLNNWAQRTHTCCATNLIGGTEVSVELSSLPKASTWCSVSTVVQKWWGFLLARSWQNWPQCSITCKFLFLMIKF